MATRFLVGFGREADHEGRASGLSIPLAKTSSARSRIFGVVTVLLTTRRSRSDRFRAHRDGPLRSFAASGRWFRQVVDDARRGADPVIHLGRRENPLDVGEIAQRDRHQATRDARTATLPPVADTVGGKGPHGQVVVACPAEPAQVSTAANHLDEETRAELGVGREDAGRRWIDGPGCLERRLLNRRHRGGTLCRHEPSRCRRLVPHIVERRARRSFAPGRAPEQPSRGRFAWLNARSSAGTRTSPSPMAITSANGRKRLGIEERHAAADDNERITIAAFRPRPAFQPAEAESARSRSPTRRRRRMRRHRSRRPASATPALRSGTRLSRSAATSVWAEEHALADDVFAGVEQAVQRWNPRFDIPTQYDSGRRAPRAGDRRCACGRSRFLEGVSCARSRCSQDFMAIG